MTDGPYHILLINTGSFCAHIDIKKYSLIEVRDSRTGYLLPVRDAQGTLPDVESCWDVAAAVAAPRLSPLARPPPGASPVCNSYRNGLTDSPYYIETFSSRNRLTDGP